MSDFTLLTKEQCFGDNQLDILEKRGTKAAITDFSILLGAQVFEDHHIDNDDSLEGRTGFYWTKTDNNASDDVIIIKGYAIKGYANYGYAPFYYRTPGARIVLPFSSILNIPMNKESKKIVNNDILEVEYGYYPQKAVAKDMQEKLNIAYKYGIIFKTKNSYTTDSARHDDIDTSFQPQTHQEYEHIGKRYVRIKANSHYADTAYFALSNGEKYKNGDYVWIEVQPVKWLVDVKAKVMITEKIIFAGIQFAETGPYRTEDFDKTNIKKFMDGPFARDLLQTRTIGEIINVSTTKNNHNPYSLNFTEVSEEDIIKSALEGNVSIFLHGKPGCGKSDRVKQLDPDFIELNLSHLDPELLDGLAGERDGKAVHIEPPWLEELKAKCQEEPEKIHILFLEELTNASPMMQAKAYGIALDKKVAGRWKLPENTRVVAAGNELEDSLVANEMAEPLYDRFAHVNIETNAESWLEWAATPESIYERLNYQKEDKQRPKIHPAIYAYISYRGDEVLRTPYNIEKPEPHADPRRWKMASDMLYASNNPNTLRAIVGENLTRDFVSFCTIPTITIGDVLGGNYTEEDLNLDIGRKLATVAGLVAVDEINMPEVREFVKKLGPEMLKKFEAQWTHGNVERLEQLQEIMMEEEQEKQKEQDESIEI